MQAMDNGEANVRVAQWADVAKAFGHFGDSIMLNMVVFQSDRASGQFRRKPEQ